MNIPFGEQTRRLREKRQLREDLLHILDTPQGERFWKAFLRHANVTRPVFHTEPTAMAHAEGKRHLAMSYISLIAGDDPQYLINQIEKDHASG